MNTHIGQQPTVMVTHALYGRISHALKKRGTKLILMGLVLAVSVLASPQTLGAGPAPVNLRSAAHFAILAGSAVTGGGGGITGDVGLSPAAGTAITVLTAVQVHGTIYAVDASGPAGSVNNPALLTAAKADLTTAYNDVVGLTNVDVVVPGAGDIGGQNLIPGLYKFESTASITGGDLTLTGGQNDVWIFQIGSTLTVGADGRHVILAGGAQARNIFWQVGSSATIGTFADFKGTILAKETITMNASCTIEGRALAQNSAATFSGLRIGLPRPEAPIFTRIFRTTNDSATVVLSTTPYFLLTLKACPDLLLTNWEMIVTDTPVTNPWTYTDYTATAAVPRRYYQAFITVY